MGTDVLKSYDSLQQELEKAKSHLKGLNDNIRRIVGPQDAHLRGDRKRNFPDNRRNDFNNTHQERQQRHRDPSPVPTKRRPQEAKSVFSRLSGPPPREEDSKPKIHSRVIRELPTRQEIVAAQGTDEQSRARNRRMFGCLLGTLQKFCQEESRLKQKEDMKAQIERKLEEQQLQERADMKRERQTLFTDRKRQQNEIRKLELKMIHLREFEACEKSRKDLRNFIRTKAKPHIYFRPKMMNDRLERRLTDSQADFDRDDDSRRAKMNDEIQIIESKFKMREDRGNNDVEDKVPDDEAGATVAATKHDRRNDDNEDDDDSMYGGQTDDEQIVPPQSKGSSDQEQNKHHKDHKDRHHKDTETKFNDTTLGSLTDVDLKLDMDTTQLLTDDYDEKNANNNSNVADNEPEDKSE